MAALPAVARQVTVEGVVHNGTTGEPARGVLLTLIRAGESKESLEQVTSGGGGRFRFQPVEAPAPPVMLLVQAEHDGVRYTEPLAGTAPVEMTVYKVGATASAIRVSERAVILHPTGGKLLVNEFYRLWNGSEPPATYASEGGTFRFYVPKEGNRSVQVSLPSASGMSIPLEPQPYAARSGVLAVRHPLKPGENRIEVSYHLDYPGSLEFASQGGRAGGAHAAGCPRRCHCGRRGVALAGFRAGDSISHLRCGQQRSLGAAADGRRAAGIGRNQEERGAAERESDVVSRLGPVGQKRTLLLAAVLVTLGMGFVRLWRHQRPVPLPSQVASGGAPAASAGIDRGCQPHRVSLRSRGYPAEQILRGAAGIAAGGVRAAAR